MAEQPRPDDLTQLRARLARLERRRRLPRRALPLLLATLLVVLIPLVTLAANPFNDLVPGSVHNGDIDAIYTAGITTGCVPNESYCPTDLVTRQEMASFLARTAGIGGNPPVTNAKTANTATTAGHASTADSATNATTAGNANTVGGYAPSGLVRVARANGPIGAFPTLTTTYTPITTVAISTPAAGFVLVSGDASVGVASSTTMIFFRLRDTATGAVSSVVFTSLAPGENDSLAMEYVFPVTGAGLHTFVLEGQSIAGTAQAGYGAVTALYVPQRVGGRDHRAGFQGGAQRVGVVRVGGGVTEARLGERFGQQWAAGSARRA